LNKSSLANASDADFMGTWGVSAKSTVAAKRPAPGPAEDPAAKAARTTSQASGEKPAVQGVAYERSNNSGKVEATLNGGLEKAPEQPEEKPTMQVNVLSGYGRRDPARYMRVRLEDVAAAQEKRFETMQAGLVGEHDLGELADMGRPSQDKALVVGRVCCEAEGKLNSMSLVLEGGIEASNGARVKLDVKYVPEYSFFPGQIVAVEGMNTEGHTMVASKVYKTAPPPAVPDVERGDLTEAPTVWVATGPFTASGDLEFEALSDLLELAQESKPDLVVLVGPFVAPNHPGMNAATLDMTYDEVFAKMMEVVAQVTEEDFTSHLALVPSPHDVHHDCVYPQPKYNRKRLPCLDLSPSHPYHKKVQCLPNPCIFSAGGMVLGVSSHDIVKELLGDETSIQQPGNKVPRIVRMANHMVEQRSFHPLFPAHPGSQVDFQHEEAFALPVRPDVLVLPSDLGRNTETLVGNTAYINPGRIVKGGNSGTFAKIQGQRLPEAVAAELGVAYKPLVDIVRL